MKSIYEQVIGLDMEKLHPKIRRRFSFTSQDRTAAIGTGVMDEIWRGGIHTLPFLKLGTFRRILFPDTGRNIPFKIENYAYVDELGRETVTWLRTFETTPRHRFDAYMIYSQHRNRIIDYLGTHQHLAVDIDLSVDEEGGIRLKSGDQRFYEGVLGFDFPMGFSGVADVREWFDESIGMYRIEVSVRNEKWGPIFGYRGRFDVEWIDVNQGDIPEHVFPVRVEPRD